FGYWLDANVQIISTFVKQKAKGTLLYTLMGNEECSSFYKFIEGCFF
ncbi:MAG: hypothetical protein ACI9EV_001583, partial [Urechidicola sp.]